MRYNLATLPMNFLAYKKILISSFLGAALIGGAYLVSTNTPLRLSYLHTKPASDYETVSLKQLIGNDADQDGVKDWEEALWGTDPKKQDSDEDGTPDPAEISAMRLAAGLPEAPMESSEDLNEIDVFAREIFAATLALRQSGELSQESLESLAGSMLDNLASTSIETFYRRGDLTVMADSAAAGRTYGETLTKTLKKYLSYNLGGELGILATAFQSENDEDLKELGNYATYYESLGADTMKLAVPEGAAEAHLLAANSYRGMAYTLSEMKYFFQNPLIGFVAFTEYLIYEKNAASAIASLEDYFKQGSF